VLRCPWVFSLLNDAYQHPSKAGAQVIKFWRVELEPPFVGHKSPVDFGTRVGSLQPACEAAPRIGLLARQAVILPS
jgi:hypothetical protein